MHYDAHRLRALAVAACCDPRTVARWLKGEPVFGVTRARLEQAAAQLGFAPPLPAAISSAGKVVA